ncbi:MAG: sigma factor-like helix-turn-helix DNA-binding protein [Candidatus Gracilibacteria bacterium]|nr:sigma factor-like helix-turn-helix DNA-binding protein [Candidatus Gracilibacteria bacterium]
MTTKSTEIQTSFTDILNNLTEKEKIIISRRIGLNGEKETLQEIGNDYNITRERVRQIEDVGTKKIGRIIKTTKLVRIQEAGEKLLELHGGLLTKDKLVSSVINELKIDSPINSGIIEVILQSDFNINKSKPQLGTKTYFFFPEVNKKAISEVHKEALKILKKKGDIMETSTLYEMIKINLFSTFGKLDTILIDSILDVFTEIVKGEEKYIGLEKWKILNPSTLKDKAIYIMKKGKLPVHFVDLTNMISNHFGESVKVATIHNELIRNNEFVLIGRGIYVLKDWGYKPGTVIDVIVDILNKSKSSLSTEEIIAKVLKSRKVKSSTVYMNLQNRQYIERVGRNLYQLKK